MSKRGEPRKARLRKASRDWAPWEHKKTAPSGRSALKPLSAWTRSEAMCCVGKPRVRLCERLGDSCHDALLQLHRGAVAYLVRCGGHCGAPRRPSDVCIEQLRAMPAAAGRNVSPYSMRLIGWAVEEAQRRSDECQETESRLNWRTA